MRRLPTLCLLALAPLTGVAPQAQAASLYNLLVGTYTEGSSEGIQVYRFDGADGSVKGPLRVAHTSNPSYLTFAPDQRTLFVVNENGRGGKGDTVGRATSYRFDPISGRLQQISQVQTLGDHPTYSSLSHDGRYLFVANYSVQPEGSVAVLPVRADGSLAPVVQVESHQASKVHPRQVSGHVHSVVSSPDGQYLFAPDLGADKVFVYRYAPEQAERPLQAADPVFVPTPPGSGPRHLIFSADGRFAYLTLELSGQVMVFAHEGNGRLRQLQTHDLAPAGFQGKVGAGALHLSADGRFLGVLNRGDDNQLVTFAVDPASGQLRFVERRSVEGTEPREFAFSPGGRFVLVANQNSDQLRVFARDPQSGQVGKTLQSVEVGSPSDLRFVAVP
ncbi:TPA: lactonase family protein [Pseudomonas aeruginosa]|uniref:gluconolactonase PpgL n=1 Tax=Pseudomonas aeruginosa TaxID=287 RepID=UPI001067D4DA|nr:gluconolactonase PpgL [Pseudomonas aeruginosa]TEG40222.1 3-carboxymuconate cyclase [Pseudomonas aeruginosa]HBP1966321.1 lactonase family protein [Pseudomonas aeruginosa]